MKARAAKPPAASKAAPARTAIAPTAAAAAGTGKPTAASAATAAGKASGTGLPADFLDTPKSSSSKLAAPSARAQPPPLPSAQANGTAHPAGEGGTATRAAAEAPLSSRERAAKKARVEGMEGALPASQQAVQTAGRSASDAFPAAAPANGAAARGSSSLPAGFFDSRAGSSTAEVDREDGGGQFQGAQAGGSARKAVSAAGERAASADRTPASAPSSGAAGLPADFFDSAVVAASTAASTAAVAAVPITVDAVPAGGGDWKGKGEGAGKQLADVKGALPEGFFDDKAADHKARGVELKKPDMQ